MATRTITTGIDIGTNGVKVVVAELVLDRVTGKKTPRLIATGWAEARGLRHGYVMGIGDAARAVSAAVRQAEKMATSGGISSRHRAARWFRRPVCERALAGHERVFERIKTDDETIC